jgi:hypothetical protein
VYVKIWAPRTGIRTELSGFPVSEHNAYYLEGLYFSMIGRKESGLSWQSKDSEYKWSHVIIQRAKLLAKFNMQRLKLMSDKLVGEACNYFAHSLAVCVRCLTTLVQQMEYQHDLCVWLNRHFGGKSEIWGDVNIYCYWISRFRFMSSRLTHNFIWMWTLTVAEPQSC